MSRRGARHQVMAGPLQSDLVLSAVLTVAFQAEIWLVADRLPALPVVALLALAMTAVFVLRRRSPVIFAAFIGLSWFAMLQWAGVPANQYVMVVVILMMAAYAAGTHPRTAHGALAGMIILLATCQELVIDASSRVADYVFITLLIGAAWTAGWGVRQRDHRAARLVDETVALRQERDLATEMAASHERARIARELHDIISHSVSVMVLQAGAAGEVIAGDPAGAKRSIEAVQQTGREALVELRRLLGVLGDEVRPDPMSPQPGVNQLPTLIDTMRRTGIAIDFQIQGTPHDLPRGVDVSAFRIVQEALTNSARHAGPAEVQVVLSYDENELAIQVLDTGRPAAGPVQPGRGLVGMGERVALHAGRFEAGPEPTGGFAVRAWIPLAEAPR